MSSCHTFFSSAPAGSPGTGLWGAEMLTLYVVKPLSAFTKYSIAFNGKCRECLLARARA